MNELLIKGLLVGLAALAWSDVQTNSREEEAACAEVKEEIREIQSRMRAGYTRAQGEKYEAKLRKLKTKRRKLCP